jgi:hypothetical protein
MDFFQMTYCTLRIHYKDQPVNAAWRQNRFCCENHKNTNILCEKNAEFWYVKAGSAYSNHQALKV